MDLIYSLIAVIGTLVVSFIVSLFLPGIERKFIHARIQQRVGPPITSPGIMAPIKFFFKQTITPESPMPRLYNALPLISLIIIVILLLFLIPQMYFLGALASIIAIIGLLKVEEIMYIVHGQPVPDPYFQYACHSQIGLKVLHTLKHPDHFLKI
jgi:energy-converting hydrogenase B subunit O